MFRRTKSYSIVILKEKDNDEFVKMLFVSNRDADILKYNFDRFNNDQYPIGVNITDLYSEYSEYVYFPQIESVSIKDKVIDDSVSIKDSISTIASNDELSVLSGLRRVFSDSELNSRQPSKILVVEDRPNKSIYVYRLSKVSNQSLNKWLENPRTIKTIKLAGGGSTTLSLYEDTNVYTINSIRLSDDDMVNREILNLTGEREFYALYII